MSDFREFCEAHDGNVLKRSQKLRSRVREYFIEVTSLCELNVDVLLTGTGRLSRVLQKDEVHKQRTSRVTSLGTDQDLAGSTSPDAAPNDATNGYQASLSASSGEAWGGEILVANNIAPSAEVFNKRAHVNGDTSAPANIRHCGQPAIEPYHHMPTTFSVRDLSEAQAKLAGGRSYGMVMNESFTQGSDRILPLGTNENQHVQSTVPSRPFQQSGHQQDQPRQSSPRENCTTRAPVAMNCTQPNAELVRHHETTNLSTPVTGQRYTDSSFTMTTPLSNQAGSATPDAVGRYAPQDLALLDGAMQRHEVSIQSLPLSSGPNQERLGSTVEGMQYLDHQSQPNGKLGMQQNVAHPTTMFSSSTNDRIRIPNEAGEASYQSGSTNRPGLHVQNPIPMTQGLGWEGTSYNAQVTGLDPRYWLNLFPPDTHN